MIIPILIDKEDADALDSVLFESIAGTTKKEALTLLGLWLLCSGAVGYFMFDPDIALGSVFMSIGLGGIVSAAALVLQYMVKDFFTMVIERFRK